MKVQEDYSLVNVQSRRLKFVPFGNESPVWAAGTGYLKSFWKAIQAEEKLKQVNQWFYFNFLTQQILIIKSNQFIDIIQSRIVGISK